MMANKSNGCGVCCTKIENFSVVKNDEIILDDVNLHIHCGELTAIIGPNGAGKSTLLKAIIGEVDHGGNLKFAGNDGQRKDAPIIGYVPQKLDFDADAPSSVIDLFCAANSKKPVFLRPSKTERKKIEGLLDKVECAHLLNKKLGVLSGGELQRVMLALALNPLPEILLLDEPISGVDKKGTKVFYDLVSTLRNTYDMTIILVSHDLSLVAKYADRVVFLNKSVICSGPPKRVMTHPSIIKTFGKILIDNQ